MKKHEALTKAMADYPDGTLVWIGDEKTQLKMPYTFGTTAIHDINYNSIYEMSTGYWFEKVEEEKTKKLEGKIAVRFDNQQQLDIICKHFNIKMATTYDRIINTNGNIKPYLFTDRESTFDSFHYAKGSGYKCITFDTFIKELGITVPDFVIRSEDGVNLYQKDTCYTVVVDNLMARFGNSNGYQLRYTDPAPNIKYFVSIESAKKWIQEHNKPKEIIIDHFAFRFIVSKDSIHLYHGDSDLSLTHSDIKELYDAHQSLQS